MTAAVFQRVEQRVFTAFHFGGDELFHFLQLLCVFRIFSQVVEAVRILAQVEEFIAPSMQNSIDPLRHGRVGLRSP